jgi:hypothetical protein
MYERDYGMQCSPSLRLLDEPHDAAAMYQTGDEMLIQDGGSPAKGVKLRQAPGQRLKDTRRASMSDDCERFALGFVTGVVLAATIVLTALIYLSSKPPSSAATGPTTTVIPVTVPVVPPPVVVTAVPPPTVVVTTVVVPRPPSTTVTVEPPPATPAPDPRRRQIEEQRSLLRQGKIAFDAPRRMTVQKVTTVRVTVADSSPPTDFPSSGPTIIVTPAPVGSDVRADLNGDGFTIARVGAEEGNRTLADGRSAVWTWQVTPQISGQRQLFVSLFVRVNGPDGAPIDTQTFQQDITVEVNPSYSIGDFFKTWWPATGLTVPVILGALVAWSRRRRQTGNPPQPELSSTPDAEPPPPAPAPPLDASDRPPPGYL